MKMRTHTCGQLRPADAGAKVELCGWVDSVRDHGGLIFLDLRDRYGVTQCVFDPQDSQAAWDAAQACRGEFVVKISGEVRPRPADMVNARIATGGIEVRGTAIAVLNKAHTPPFHSTTATRKTSAKTCASNSATSICAAPPCSRRSSCATA
jgi:aspartyl-tRNA synthetase